MTRKAWGWMRTGRALLIPVVLAACSSDPAEPVPAPVITISGVEAGETYTEPVTITISVDLGSYTATLNGEPFTSGSTVTEIGTHVLSVDAENEGSRSNEQITFFMTLGGARILIIRVFDLGDNLTQGGGDAILVADSSSAGLAYALIDAGPRGANGADSTYVARRLDELGVTTLEALVLTHAHADHYWGIPPAIANRRVKRFFYNGQQTRDDRYAFTIGTAAATADTFFVVESPITRGLADPGSPVITVLSPLPAFVGNPDATDVMLDESALGTSVAFGDFKVFLAGDGRNEANNRWRNAFASTSVESDLLKVGHHGDSDAIFNNTLDGPSIWLDHTQPKLAIISANGVSHPERTTVAELSARGIQSYCTHVHGEIVVRANNRGQYLVEVERNEGQPCTEAN